MFLSKRVPPEVRDAYNKDAWSGILVAVMSGLTVPFFAIIAREQLKASPLEISTISMAPVAGSVLSLYWAHVMQRYCKMKFATVMWLVSRALLFTLLFATTSWSFITIITLFWIIGGAAGPAYTALMKDIYPDGERVKIMAYVRICLVVASIVITAIAGPLLKIVSYRYVFPVASIFGIASTLAFARIKTNDSPETETIQFGAFIQNAIDILRNDHAFRWFCGGVVIFGGAFMMAVPIYTIYQVDILHVDTRWGSLYTVVTLIFSMAAYYYWGPYIDRKKLVTVVVMNSLIFCIIPIFYCIATKAWMLLPVSVIAGVTNAGLELSYFSCILHYASTEKITIYQSIFASITGIRGAIVPFIGAALVQRDILSMNALFIFTGVLMLIGVGVQAFGMWKYEIKKVAPERLAEETELAG